MEFVRILLLILSIEQIDSIVQYSPVDLKPISINRKLIWKQFVDLNNPINWSPTRTLPCPRDRLVFPENYAIWIDRKWTTTELVRQN